MELLDECKKIAFLFIKRQPCTEVINDTAMAVDGTRKSGRTGRTIIQKSFYLQDNLLLVFNLPSFCWHSQFNLALMCNTWNAP